MPTYHAPGIYVEEVQTGARPIELVGTSTAAFLGVPPIEDRFLNEARPFDNWSEFERTFVGDRGAPGNLLANAVFGFFQNGGSYCYVVNVGKGQSLAGTGKGRTGIQVLEEIDDISIVAAPGACDPASHATLLEHCEIRMKDRVAILDPPEKVDEIRKLTEVEVEAAASDDPKKKPAGGLRPRESPGGFGAFYFPWLLVADALAPSKRTSVPPSGHMAGIYARTDARRGVHKAPANEPVAGALNLAWNVTRQEQELLNQSGVNCIRMFRREGILVWGARTLAPAASNWRYVPVRRLFCQIEESIANGTRWVVFEPNDEPLWKAIVRDVGGLLTRVWRDGALMGRTPEEAFFVKCDRETNPPENIDAGTVTIVVGMAPVKPAEFVVFRIGQTAAGVTTEAL
jgi:phage tail sheath protein FI